MVKRLRQWQRNITISLFTLFLVYWIIIHFIFPQYNTHHLVYSFSTVYGIMALWGAIAGIVISRGWGGYKSVIGMAILMFSFGLLAQEFGQLYYSYSYIILHLKSADYPSIGDLGFFGSIPIYIYGTYLLGKSSGVKVGLKSFENKIQAVVIPLIILIIGYWIFLRGYVLDWSNPIKVFLDFGYPLGQAVYISMAILVYLLSRNILGGIMKKTILLILFALCIQFISDYSFLYQISNNTWEDGGINDLTYLVSYFVMSLAIIQFNTVFKKLREEGKK